MSGKIPNGKWRELLQNQEERNLQTVQFNRINNILAEAFYADDILIAKLRLYGAECVELDWFIAHLDKRKQCCKVNGKVPKIKDTECGVPQGSCPGTLLSLIFSSLLIVLYTLLK